jgi:cell wall-associated NlpC family hydrolase
MWGPKAIATLLSLVALAAPTAAVAATGGVAPPSGDSSGAAPAPPSGPTGGSAYDPNAPVMPPGPPGVARLIRGVAYPPAGAPQAVVRAIRAGNKLQDKPYRYGGGHGSFRDTAYDCSGTVSFALHGGGLLRSPLASGDLMTWGRAGRGRWITVYSNPGHAYAVIAGLRLDTSGTGGRGPRWQALQRDRAGFVARHPAGL